MSSASGQQRIALPASPGAMMGVIVALVGLCFAGVLLLYYWYTPAHDINDTYGKRRGFRAVDSVNGTAVLAKMFEASGRSVNSISELGPRVERYDTIVWTPNKFTVPGNKVVQFLENWLMNKPNRTLIYIGRDHDSSPEYWQRMIAQVPPAERDEYERRWANAQARVHAQQTPIPNRQPCSWFVVQGNEPRRRIDSLDGPWAEGIDVQHTEIVLDGRLDIPAATTSEENAYGPKIDIILQSENDILAHSYMPNAWNKSKVVVVANGSFTLNMSLVNQEHRKLAGRMIDATQAGGDVAFLESGPSDPVVRKASEGNGSQNALHLFTIWPISLIFVHLAALGLAYSIYRFPLFGRPQRLPAEQRADFGQHVTALGELLRRTKDVAHAQQRLEHYHSQSRRASGKSHAAKGK